MKVPAEQMLELEQRLSLLEAKESLIRETDELLERAMRDHLPLARALDALLPVLAAHSGARAVLLYTVDESLSMRAFAHQSRPDPRAVLSGAPSESDMVGVPLSALVDAMDSADRREWIDVDRTTLAQRLDVAGEGFGLLALGYPDELGPTTREVGFELMNAFAEQLDNYLVGIAHAREKVAIVNALSEAFRASVLDSGLDRAIAILRNHVSFDDMLLVFKHDEAHGACLRYKIIEDGRLTHDSLAPSDADLDAFIRDNAGPLIREGSRALVERFLIGKFREEHIVRGLRHDAVLGRLTLTTRRGEFSTRDRDLVERFLDFLERRLIDYSKEWRTLAAAFSERSVQRMLADRDYRARYLAPREAMVATMFCDISGFTRIAEQHLREPAKIAELIEVWSRHVVSLLWQQDAVFDKMVGDCVIGLFGPPFFEWSPREACERAAHVARQIRDYTATLVDVLPSLRDFEGPIGVATGLHFCPLHVGLFGPDEDYTGFSSGMNNTARLQGLATRGEILCMDAFVDAFGDPSAFGEERSAPVKNVHDPLRFRALR